MIGLVVSSKRELKETIRNHKVRLGKHAKGVKSDISRAEVACEGNKWRIFLL